LCANRPVKYSALVLLCLAGCTVNSVQSKSPAATYASERSRDVVSECLMNRLNHVAPRARIDRGEVENVIFFYTDVGIPVLVATIRNDGNGSFTELRRSNSLFPIGNAQTCF
jgi:hypothetical protein